MKMERFEEAEAAQAASRALSFGPPRRDGVALGFGAAFIVLGSLGLLRAAGVELPGAWLQAVVLVGLGALGLASLWLRRR